jgi:hypothetical protein
MQQIVQFSVVLNDLFTVQHYTTFSFRKGEKYPSNIRNTFKE